MSVLTDLATHGILNRELATQWQQMMGSMQRVELETMTPQNMANAIENMNRTRIDATGNRLRLKDGERPYSESWSGSTSLAGFAREIAARLRNVDPKHEAGSGRRRLVNLKRFHQVQPRKSSTNPWKLTQSIKLQTEENKGRR